MNTCNQFEKSWKLETCLQKFNIVPYCKSRLFLNTEKQLLSPQGKLLGLTLSKQGYGPHITNTVHKANYNLSKLYRFRNLTSKQKRLLYISTVRSVLTYPVVPTCGLPYNQICKLQRIQNKGIRFITNYKYDPDNKQTMLALHLEAGLNPINIELYKQSRKVWDSIKNLMPEKYDRLEQVPSYHKINNKFPLTLKLNEPRPQYTVKYKPP
jgi:hypothetical protein